MGRALIRLVQWQNARAHLISCLLSQKLGLFHHCGQLDFPVRDGKVPLSCLTPAPHSSATEWPAKEHGKGDRLRTEVVGEGAPIQNEGFKVKGLEPGVILHSSQEPNPFLLPTMEVETLIRNASPPLSREQGRLSGSSRGGGSLSLDTFPFDEALRDITAARPSSTGGPAPRPPDPVTYHGQQFLEIKMTERKGEERARQRVGKVQLRRPLLMPPTPRAGAPDEDGEPVCNLAAAFCTSQHAHQCE